MNEDVNNTFPKSWAKGLLNDVVCSVKTGIREYKGSKNYYSTGSINNHSSVPTGCYTFQSRPSRANRISHINDIFQARMKETSKALLIDEGLAGELFSTGFIQIQPYGDTYYPKLLYYFIQSNDFLHQRDELASGSTQEALTDRNSKKLMFPLPPLNEQKRIVAKLDKIMPKIDVLRERLNRIPQIIKRFRQSVLNAAVTGKLTEEWRKGKSCQWENTNLGTLSEYITSGSRGWAKYYSSSGAIFVRAQNINTDRLELNDIAYVKLPKNVEGKRTQISKNDILITITGANVTKTAQVTINLKEAYVNQHIALVRVNNKNFASYLYLWLISPIAGRLQLEKLAYGAGKPGLNLQNIKDVVVMLPSLEEQKEIVRQVNKLFTLADNLETRYQKAKEKLDKLPRSVLAKTFRGELVPQNPNDEPASELLKKIIAEKEKLQAEIKQTKKRKVKSKPRKKRS